MNLSDQQLISSCFTILEQAKARDIVSINVRDNSSIADFMLICSGTSSRHVSAIALRLEEKLYAEGVKGIKLSGENIGDWVVVDIGTIIVHVMQPEVRERYALDDLYRCMAAGRIEERLEA